MKSGKTRKILSGINEKGLVIVSAAAEGLKISKNMAKQRDLTIETILESFDSVSLLLENLNVFSKSHPAFYILGDKSKISLIEIAPYGKISVRSAENGFLCHTNHYIDETFSRFNGKIDRSNVTRLDRIQYLLQNVSPPLTIDNFIAFTKDTNDGPHESILRTGSRKTKVYTKASWVVMIPKNGAPELFLRIADSTESEIVYEMKLDTPFWTEGIR